MSLLLQFDLKIIVKRPRILSTQFVALYKPCKPIPKPDVLLYVNDDILHRKEVCSREKFAISWVAAI